MPLYGASAPLDSDLTAIAALSTTAYGRALLELANAGAGRTALELGTAATHAHGDYEVAGAAAAAQAASQPLDSDLTAVAALTSTAYGRSLLELADAAAARTAIGAQAVISVSQGFTTGRYYAPLGVGTTSPGAIGRMGVVPFSVGEQQTFDRIAIDVTTLQAGATMRLVIYADNGECYPNALVLDAGTIDASSTGQKEVTISQALAPGLYWVGAAWQGSGSAATVRALNPVSGSAPPFPNVGQLTLADISTVPNGPTQTGVTGAAPANFTAASGATVATPKVALRAA